MSLLDSFENWKSGHQDNTGKCVTILHRSNGAAEPGEWRTGRNCNSHQNPYVCKMDARATDVPTTSEITSTTITATTTIQTTVITTTKVETPETTLPTAGMVMWSAYVFLKLTKNIFFLYSSLL